MKRAGSGSESGSVIQCADTRLRTRIRLVFYHGSGTLGKFLFFVQSYGTVPVGDELLHEAPVERALHLSHAHEQNMLCLHRQGFFQNYVATPKKQTT
jgi:hypothetical protein